MGSSGSGCVVELGYHEGEGGVGLWGMEKTFEDAVEGVLVPEQFWMKAA